MWGPSFLGSARSISWLLMPWLLVNPGHQHTWYWLYRIGKSLSYTTKDFNNLCHVSVEELGMSTARRHLKSPPWLSGTSAHPTKVTLVNVMVMNRWLTSFSFHVNRLPHSWIKAISDSDLKIPRSRSWVRSKVKVTYNIQYPTNALPLRFTSIRPTIPEIWPKSNQVITMTRAITLPCFLVVQWVVLNLSRRQTNFG